MDIPVSNIGPTTDGAVVKAVLSDILYNPPVAELGGVGGLPVDFSIGMIPLPAAVKYQAKDARNRKGKRGQPRDGIETQTARLIIPDVKTAERFLSLYGTSSEDVHKAHQVVIDNFRLKFGMPGARARPDPKILEELGKRPYMDAKAISFEEALIKDIDPETKVDKLPIQAVQFGRWCRDNCFSVEWTHIFADNEYAEAVFEVPARELEVPFTLNFPSLTRYAIVIPWERIITVTWDDEAAAYWELGDPETKRGHCALLHLDVPPSFEKREPRSDDILRSKVKSILTENDPMHQYLVPFISHTMRIVFKVKNHVVEFKRRCDQVRIPIRYKATELYCERRFLYSGLDKVDRMLCDLDLRVALACAGLIMNPDHLCPEELLTLRPELDQVLVRYTHDYNKVADILNLFADELRIATRLSYPLLIAGRPVPRRKPKSVLQCLKDAETALDQSPSRPPARGGLWRAYTAIMTPTSLHLDGPYMDLSNSVLRMWPEHQHFFLRLKFTDEAHLQIRKERDIDTSDFMDDLVRVALKHGIDLAGRHWDFLSYSLAALRDHSVWMVTPFNHPEHGQVNADTIRRGLGDFSRVIYCPARYGARLSQAFSATEPSIRRLSSDIIQRIPDRIHPRTKSNFTDGVGTISPNVANMIWEELIKHRPRHRTRDNPPPSVYQIRIGGYKGVLCVDPLLQGTVVRLRPSMDKFDAPDSCGLEIARSFEKPMTFFLNRPLIMILECLGVPIDVFIGLQTETVQQAKLITDSVLQAAKMLDMYALGSSFRLSYVLRSIQSYLRMDFGRHQIDSNRYSDPFLEYALSVGRCNILRELRFRARIPMPQSWTLVGVADEYDILEPLEIYACVQSPEDREPYFIEGRVLITRSPAMGPGDVQFVNAIGKPSPNSPFLAGGRPICNCVVFSCRGQRAVASMLGGGDLDGDIFNLIQYERAFPRQVYPADNYEPAELRKSTKPCTIDDVAEFVVDYIKNDVVGMIATHHLIIADQETHGVHHPDCEELARLYGLALDFVKTGSPIDLDNIPRPRLRIRPDYMATEFQADIPDPRLYPSQRALGRLFRDPNIRIDPEEVLTGGEVFKEDWQSDRGEDDAVDPLRKRLTALVSRFISPAYHKGLHPSNFKRYSEELAHICSVYSLGQRTGTLQESEVLMGTILAKTAQTHVRRDRITRLRVQTAELVHWLKDTIRGPQSAPLTDQLQQCWMAWDLARSKGNAFGAKTFGLIALRTIFEVLDAILDPEGEQPTIRYHSKIGEEIDDESADGINGSSANGADIDLDHSDGQIGADSFESTDELKSFFATSELTETFDWAEEIEKADEALNDFHRNPSPDSGPPARVVPPPGLSPAAGLDRLSRIGPLPGLSRPAELDPTPMLGPPGGFRPPPGLNLLPSLGPPPGFQPRSGLPPTAASMPASSSGRPSRANGFAGPLPDLPAQQPRPPTPDEPELALDW